MQGYVRGRVPCSWLGDEGDYLEVHLVPEVFFFYLLSSFPIGTLHLACWTGWMLGSLQIMYVLGMLPMVLKRWGRLSLQILCNGLLL